VKIGIIGHLKYPIAKPFAGGLESFTDTFVRRLIRRGHHLQLFASGDSDPSLPLSSILDYASVLGSQRQLGRVDHHFVEGIEDEAYSNLCKSIGQADFDVIHNHSLSPIPLRFAALLPCPLITTLHAPPLRRMTNELAERRSFDCGTFVNISQSNAAAWQRSVSQQAVVHNGIDVDVWQMRARQDGPHRAIWFGRIHPDKGTHLAIDAAVLAGLPVDVVGPIADHAYFRAMVVPRLGKHARYLGHKDHQQLCQLIGRASVTLVTPCWEEPFGLVVAESLSCGTPVAGFARGALTEILDASSGALVDSGDVHALATAIGHCLTLDGQECRRIAVRRFSFKAMLDRYEQLYARCSLGVAA